MPDAEIDRIYDYDPKYLADILASVKTIAMVGASADKTKFSYGVLRQLSEIGYDILPVNPNPNVTEIRGLKVYHSLEEIEKPVDMVDVFRPKEELYGFAEKAIEIGAKVLWGQIGVYDDEAAPQYLGPYRNGLLGDAVQLLWATEHLDHVDGSVDFFQRVVNPYPANFGQRGVRVHRHHIIARLVQHSQHAIAELGLVSNGTDHGDGLHRL